MTKFFFILSNDAVLSAARSAAVSKSGFNLFNAVVLPSQTALWFMNTLHANAFYYASFSCGNRRIILNGAEEEAQALLSIQQLEAKAFRLRLLLEKIYSRMKSSKDLMIQHISRIVSLSPLIYSQPATSLHLYFFKYLRKHTSNLRFFYIISFALTPTICVCVT